MDGERTCHRVRVISSEWKCAISSFDEVPSYKKPEQKLIRKWELKGGESPEANLKYLFTHALEKGLG
jgi:hypothetical protein